MTVTLDKSVEDFVATPRQLFIDGRWVDAASGRTFATPNPATGRPLAQVAEPDAEDVERAVRAARRAFDGPWSRLTPSERGRLIWKIGDLILEHADEPAQLESLDNGKPLAVARAADIPLSADKVWPTSPAASGSAPGWSPTRRWGRWSPTNNSSA
ncbi:aldehyde dehydrogenase family protein [Nonomuraea sp. NPDC051941]|uniref:aldehyde dehydrogenase family protein n=1 Tax=Nonomuraea sp. NPDC051941 TaxID=3364373 RepID=UPI0037C840B3